MSSFVRQFQFSLFAVLMALSTVAQATPQWEHEARLKAQNKEMVAGLKGQLSSIVLPPSPLLQNKRVTAWVYLPPDYTKSQTHYPVAYLLHGSPGQGRDWFVDAKAQRVAESLIMQGKVAPMIVVTFDGFGPKGLNDPQDYLDSADGSFSMETFVTKTLVPWVDSHYRTRTDPYSRSLIGFSAGGYGAANLGFKHPDIWRVIASIAGFFDPSDDTENITRILGPKSKNWDDNSLCSGFENYPEEPASTFSWIAVAMTTCSPNFKK